MTANQFSGSTSRDPLTIPGPELLYSQFSKFTPGQVAGVAKVMSQLYRLYIYLDVEDNSDKLLEIIALIVSGLSVTECLQETNCLSNNK